MGLTQVADRFKINGRAVKVRPFGSGHIHDTYTVLLHGSDQVEFLLQKINTNVFRDVPGMMQNIALVTDHVGKKLSMNPDDPFKSLELIPGTDGELYVQQDDAAWRMYRFLEGLTAYDMLPSASLAAECGKGYGRFLYLLEDLPASHLVTTIPRFHDISLRLDQLETAREHSSIETDGLYELVKEMATVMLTLNERDVPLRIIHNDTKANNILFTREGKAACVVDLDTVMPGKLWYDTGDSLRSVMSDTAEDADNSSSSVNTDYYEAFLKGFLSETNTILTQGEWSCLPLSGAYMAFIMGVRFLTDHLNGDVYYKTAYRGHNLQRAQNQLTLAHRICGMEAELTGLLEKIRADLN